MPAFDYCSDLHLDFDQASSRVLACFPEKRSPYLILAGDVVEISALKGEVCPLQTQVSNFFEWVSANYTKIIYVLGNHEHYTGCITTDLEDLTHFFKSRNISNIQVLNNETVEIEDVVIFGATMWTSCRKRDPLVMRTVYQNLSDYNYIKILKEGALTHLEPEDTVALHEITLKALTQFKQQSSNKKKIVVTHHAPHLESISAQYRTSNLNAAFYEELFHFIAGSDFKVWLHGHTHSPSQYSIDTTRILANPRGYYGYEKTDSFSVKSFDLSET